jgi:starch synthase
VEPVDEKTVPWWGAALRVLFATPEIADFVQVGGLAAVSAALPRALRSSADIRVIVPGYPEVLAQIESYFEVGTCKDVAALPSCAIGMGYTRDGLPVYVVQCAALFEREGTPYGDRGGQDWPDNDVRFARFSAAAAALAAGKIDPNWNADLVHANDWQSALIPAYLGWGGCHVPSIFTIHNLAYQGLFEKSSLRQIGAPDSAFHIEGVEFYDKLSFLKAGIVYASHLTTVSQTYAQEITTPEFGCGLDGLLRKRADASQLSGILNGIDQSWDPRACKNLGASFGIGEWHERAENTRLLREEFGLAVSRGPLFALVARLVHQKGVDLVLSAADTILQAGGQLVVTGKGEPQFEQALLAAHSRHPDAIGVNIGFEEGQARRIFAGSDFTLTPSRFEPCGLTQMYAQRYGSLPLGHQIGGLAETIIDDETGFLFKKPFAATFMGSLCRAFSLFGDKERLGWMRSRAMDQEFSWAGSAAAYQRLYKAAA